MSLSTEWPPVAACDGARKCILVVEDELLIRFMVSDGLRNAGFHVIEACNADEALIILKTALPDILITDVRMPGSLDGIGLLRAVGEHLPTLPVIIMSGHMDPAQAIAKGAAKFVAKPYMMDAVFQAVHDVLAEAE